MDRMDMVQRLPQAVLELLNKVPPEDMRHWPYNTSATLKLIGEQDPALATDQRLLILMRKLEHGA